MDGSGISLKLRVGPDPNNPEHDVNSKCEVDQVKMRWDPITFTIIHMDPQTSLKKKLLGWVGEEIETEVRA